MRILLVEDDSSLARIVLQGLKAEKFAVDVVHDGEDALYYISQIDYDLVLLDLGLPKLNGMSVLKQARKKRMRAPVMILSARNTVEDRVLALDAGADDFLLKPFAFSELVARVHALLRRPPTFEDKLVVADLELDRLRHTVTRAGKTIVLTQKEYALLEYLMRNAGRPVSRSMIIEHVWNLGFEGLTNIVDVYINYLRVKLETGSPEKLIHTARGIGYMLMENHERVAVEHAA